MEEPLVGEASTAVAGPSSSRICVKGLPKHCDERRLRQHLLNHSDGDLGLTDVKVMRTADGRPRQFGFVGFRTAEAAERARVLFNRSFIDTSRIAIEHARAFGDAELQRPWSRHSKGSSAYVRAHPEEAPPPAERPSAKEGKNGKKQKKTSAVAAAAAADPKLAEFLRLADPKSHKLWSDGLEEGGAPGKRGAPQQPQEQQTRQGAAGQGTAKRAREEDDDEEEDDEEYDELPSERRAVGGGAADEDEEEAAAVKGAGGTEMSDLEYMRSKMVGKLDDDDEEMEEGEEDEEEGGEEDEEGEEAASEEATVAVGAAAAPSGAGAADDTADLADQSRLFVRNLAFDVSEEDLEALFSVHGPVAELHLPMDADTRRGKGFAYVSYENGEDAVTALSALDGTIFQGRLLHILPARATPNAGKSEGGGGGVGSSSYKDKKEAKLKAAAGDSVNWNSLFMRPDAVGDAMAERYGVAKSEFLDATGSGSLAVRLAQGETHIVHQSTEWLAQHGVSLEALQQAASAGSGGRGRAGADGTKRSKTLILVKNLAADTKEEELTTLFGKYGQITSVLLTPANTLGLVEFLEVGEAKRAFRSLAYYKHRNVPLYLEWAPVGLLQPPAATAAAAGTGGEASSGGAAAGASSAAAGGAEEEEGASGEGCTVFVKNLNFKSTDADLRALFESKFKVRSASIVTRKDPKGGAKSVSMGYGFVEFKAAADAKRALREMIGVRLHEHVLQLKQSDRASRGAAKTAAPSAASGGKAGGDGGGADGAGDGKPSEKLMVRNLPFQANAKEVKELFGNFGQLKQVRMPKKFDGTHRGFAFVEFSSKGEAAKAMASLRNTHLYGRHLVLQYAEQEKSVEAMREKLRGQMAQASEAANAAGGARGKKKRKGGEDDDDPLGGLRL